MFVGWWIVGSNWEVQEDVFFPVVYMPSKQVIRIQPLDSPHQLWKNQSSSPFSPHYFQKVISAPNKIIKTWLMGSPFQHKPIKVVLAQKNTVILSK